MYLSKNNNHRKFTYRILLILILFALIQPASAAYADTAAAPPHPSAPQTLAQLRVADPAEIAKLPWFDSRNYGIITSVKDQKDSNLCWAYSAINASEAAILHEEIDLSVTKDTLSLSAEGLGYLRHNRGADPLGNTKGEITSSSANWYYSSGNCADAATVLSQWCGPLKSGGSINMETAYADTAYFMEDAVYIENAQNRTAVKQAIVQYGAVTFSYNNVRECVYYNPVNETGSSSYPHACTIIGWDDTIPADKFQPGGAKQDGGWIIKNSYSSLPYFYLSYDCDSTNLVAFRYAPRNAYDCNYFYDSSAQNFGLTVPGSSYAANVFEAKKGTDGKEEYIKAVSVGVKGKAVSCEIEVYTDLQEMQDISDTSNIIPTKGTLSAKQTAQFKHAGYYTVKLDNPVKIEKGSWFSIAVKLSNAGKSAAVRLVQGNAMTYFNKDYWSKNNNFTARIKAFTVLKKAEPVTAPEGYRFPYRISGQQIDEDKNFLTVTAECYQADKPALILCASYDKDNRMIGAECRSLLKQAGTRFEEKFTYPGEVFKIFILDSTATMQPFAEVYSTD